jgi:hypothetical protein
MNPLVKKEIRLLLPAWIVAVLLALIQAITRPYDFYVAALLFVGMTMMSLTVIGRETSLNTFSFMLAQPAERMRIWRTKLSVLAVVFLITFGVWLLAYGVAIFTSTLTEDDAENSYNLFITICLIATATFTGGLWTTLLLRQIAAAFWLTLLVPATLSGFTAAFAAESQSDNGVIAILCVILGIYSVGGFLFARWLFFRAQDTGWSGGIIALPEWKFTRSETAGEVRKQKTIVALFKKEFQLQQAALAGAAGLFVLHLGIVVLRTFHKFPRNSTGEILTSIFWLLWLVLPAIVGCTAIAEERKLGVVEGQLCLPASRRVQFVVKVLLAFFLGIFLGGVMPVLLEAIGSVMHAPNPSLMTQNHEIAFRLFMLYALAISAWLVLVSFFASSLAKNFLQATGFALVTFFGCAMIIPAFANGRLFFFGSLPGYYILTMLVAIPTISIMLLWLACLNFNHFHEGWPLWRRNLSGVVGALLFIHAASAGIYNRAWEVFEPAEPAHGAAKFSLADPPVFLNARYDNLLVRLPDGRVWFDYLSNRSRNFYANRAPLISLFRNPLPKSAGPQRLFSGSNWVSATAGYVDEAIEEKGSQTNLHLLGYLDSVAVKSNGTLWVSGKSEPNHWTAGKLTQFGHETNWQQVARGFEFTSVLLLKKDATLWWWGTNHFDWQAWPQTWPGLRAFQPCQIGTNSDWSEIFSASGGCLARMTDGSVWRVWQNSRNGKDELIRKTNYDDIADSQFSFARGGNWGAGVRKDGTLWLFGDLHDQSRGSPEYETLQSGKESNWVTVAVLWDWMVALKSDGTLWKWERNWQHRDLATDFNAPPTRLGIHDDWVAITSVDGGVISLAADGSLWFWPHREDYAYLPLLMKLPKQPEFLGNVFAKGD